jgi:hypothetical protein
MMEKVVKNWLPKIGSKNDEKSLKNDAKFDSLKVGQKLIKKY